MHLTRTIRGPARAEGEANPFVMLRPSVGGISGPWATRNLYVAACWKLQHTLWNEWELVGFPHVALGSPIGGRNVR